jgi:hypothetical protein
MMTGCLFTFALASFEFRVWHRTDKKLVSQLILSSGTKRTAMASAYQENGRAELEKRIRRYRVLVFPAPGRRSRPTFEGADRQIGTTVSRGAGHNGVNQRSAKHLPCRCSRAARPCIPAHSSNWVKNMIASRHRLAAQTDGPTPDLRKNTGPEPFSVLNQKLQIQATPARNKHLTGSS